MSHFVATVTKDRLIELPESARKLLRPGQEIEVEVLDRRPTAPNEKVLALLRDLAEMKKDMPESDPSDTNNIIRAGRSGAMYGL